MSVKLNFLDYEMDYFSSFSEKVQFKGEFGYRKELAYAFNVYLLSTYIGIASQVYTTFCRKPKINGNTGCSSLRYLINFVE